MAVSIKSDFDPVKWHQSLMNCIETNDKFDIVPRKPNQIGVNVLTSLTGTLCIGRELGVATANLVTLHFKDAAKSSGKAVGHLIGVAASIMAVAAEILLYPLKIGAMQNLALQRTLGLISQTNQNKISREKNSTTDKAPAATEGDRISDPEHVAGTVSQNAPIEADITFLKDKFQVSRNVSEDSVENLQFNLFRAGIKTPNDCKIEKVYVAGYVASTANQVFGGEGWSGEFEPSHSNYLRVLVPSDDSYEHAMQRFQQRTNFYVLHPKDFVSNASLNKDFVRIIREGF